jgi:hypothetical protein
MDVPSIEYVPLYLRALGTGWMFVELANTLDNLGLQKALSTNGRIMVEEFTAPLEQGSHQMFRWRIDRAS